MHRRRRKADCRKYEKWKEERARASKQTEKGTERQRRREPVIDGLAEGGEVEEVTPSKTVSRVRYRKCRTRGTKETPRKCIRKLVRRISYAELVLGCIKPSLEERKYLLDRHIGCVGLSVDIAPETPRLPAVQSRLIDVKIKPSTCLTNKSNFDTSNKKVILKLSEFVVNLIAQSTRLQRQQIHRQMIL
ncbi:hypothetical protein K0M31_013097 [Melipona bicolor]|uniref:Uncharacterized protein n=1 Tax=Melipona bicolor TaxID=60889 RepID=A0AA40KGS8_9HYME|nr:hypothetical protein K0M31_013097 [Melipona bicolor]